MLLSIIYTTILNSIWRNIFILDVLIIRAIIWSTGKPIIKIMFNHHYSIMWFRYNNFFYIGNTIKELQLLPERNFIAQYQN